MNHNLKSGVCIFYVDGSIELTGSQCTHDGESDRGIGTDIDDPLSVIVNTHTVHFCFLFELNFDMSFAVNIESMLIGVGQGFVQNQTAIDSVIRWEFERTFQ